MLMRYTNLRFIIIIIIIALNTVPYIYNTAWGYDEDDSENTYYCSRMRFARYSEQSAMALSSK